MASASSQAGRVVPQKNLYIQAGKWVLQTPMVMAALLFLPAWTFDFGEAWVVIANFLICSLGVNVYLAIKDPKLLERRLNLGPASEKEKKQKNIMGLLVLSFAGTMIVPAIDHRFGWSDVPASIVILGNALIVLGFLALLLVFRENTYGASTIQVAEGQTVVSSGPYAMVRHPMYSGTLVMVLGIPLALGSWWGVLMFAPIAAGIIWRILDEESFLLENLTGYSDYTNKVRYRLVSFVW